MLHSAGNTDHLLDPTEIRRHLIVGNRPVHIKPIQAGSLEIDLTEAAGGTAPKIGFPACHFTPHPLPITAWGIHISHIVLPETLSVLVLVMVSGELGVAEASILHLVALPMAAEVLRR